MIRDAAKSEVFKRVDRPDSAAQRAGRAEGRAAGRSEGLGRGRGRRSAGGTRRTTPFSWFDRPGCRSGHRRARRQDPQRTEAPGADRAGKVGGRAGTARPALRRLDAAAAARRRGGASSGWTRSIALKPAGGSRTRGIVTSLAVHAPRPRRGVLAFSISRRSRPGTRLQRPQGQ